MTNDPLRMIRATIDLAAFNRWAADRGLVHPRGAFDEGYALHALLTESFGAQAPRPFRMMPAPGGRTAVLYGYGAAPAEILADSARRCADPLHLRALPPDSLACKSMPDHWTEGKRYAFEVRVRPVRRSDKNGDRARSQERDAFQAEAETHPPAGMPRSREAVYGDWLAERLEHQGGARLDGPPTLAHFRRTAILRKGAQGKHRLSEGPDAVLRGRLAIRDAARFHALLAEGIGRQKAFGYGMVLVRPC